MASGSTQGDIIREIDDDLTCSVCLELLQNARMLKCAHTFCLECMSGLVKEKYRRGGVVEWYIKCPHCREDTEITDGKTVADLPRPLPLQRLAELREKVSTFIASASSPSGSYNGNCDVCEERGDTNVNAVALCVNCDTELCAKCRECHNHRFKDEHHQLRSLTHSDACKLHSQKMVTKYCDTCRILLCPLCVMGSHDSAHKLLDIADKARQCKEDVNRAVSVVQKGSVSIKMLRRHVKAQKIDIGEGAEAVTKRIDDQVESWKRHVERAGLQLKTRVEEIKLLGIQQLDVYVQDTEANIASKLSLVSLAEELLQGTSDSELIFKSDDLLQLLQEEGAFQSQHCALQVPFFSPNTSFSEISLGTVAPMTRRIPLTNVKEVREAEAPLLPISEPSYNMAHERASSLKGHPSPVPGAKQGPGLRSGPMVRVDTPPRLHGASPEGTQRRGSSQVQESRDKPNPNSNPPRPAFVLRAQTHIKTSYIKDMKVSTRHNAIYVSTRSTSKPIQIFDYHGALKGYLGMGLSNPWGICTNSRHGIIAVCAGNCIQLFNQNNLRFLKTVNNNNFQNLMFATYCEDSKMYAFTDTKEKSIHFVDDRTFRVVRRINLSSRNMLPWSISFTNTPRPGVILNDISSPDKNIHIFDLAGNDMQQLANPGPTEKWNPIKCRSDHLSNLLVVDSENDRVGRFVDVQQELWHNLLSSEHLSGGRPEHCDLSRDGLLAVGCNAYQDAVIHVFSGYQ